MARPIRNAEIRSEPVRQEPVREEVRPKRTRARKGGMHDQLHVPAEMIPPGMDYQWVTDSVLEQPMVSRRMSFEANGWEPVPASRHDGLFMPKGYQGEIKVGGMVLMERPLELTMEARAEERSAAQAPRQTQQRQLSAGQIDGVTLPDGTTHPSARRNTYVKTEIVSGTAIPND